MIIFDIDGTLADCSHRVHHAKVGDWDAFHETLSEDKLYQDIVWLLEFLGRQAEHFLVALTGRPEKYRTQTEEWMSRKGILHHFDGIVMRQDQDWTKDQDFKLREIKTLEEKHEQRCMLIFEDRDNCVEHLR